MSALLDQLRDKDTGLLITVDEINPEEQELVQLASLYQLFIREHRKVGLVMAGLPKNATDLADNDRITFLRRSRKRHLGRIADVEIERAFRKSFEGTGKSIADDLLELAVSASGGFPYMMQLVGYNIWEECAISETVTRKDVERGIAAARSEFTDNELDELDELAGAAINKKQRVSKCPKKVYVIN